MSAMPDRPVAIVTGASSGIGEATARRLARTHALILVARRQDRLDALAASVGGASVVAVDLTADDAPARVRETVEREHGGRLDLLVNNAGARWSSDFYDGGFDNVRKTMAINFDAVVRLTHELLPLLRKSAPSSIVMVSSTSGRVARKGAAAYSASKFALAGFSDSLALEEAAHGVHVGLVLPGFVTTEGFPQQELVDSWKTRWAVTKPETIAEAIVDAGPGGKAERYSPRGYAIPAAIRVVAPRILRKALSSGGDAWSPQTNARD
jgi:uncharacterized protein